MGQSCHLDLLHCIGPRLSKVLYLKCHFNSAYPDSCVDWGTWISNSKPMGKFKDDIEHIDNILAQTTSCRNPVTIKCVTNGYQTEVILGCHFADWFMLII